jgi:hypothetical protein
MTTPPEQPLDEAPLSVVLNASGYGLVTFQPESFRNWVVTSINVLTDQGPTTTPVPRCKVYLGGLGGRVIAQTWMGNGDTASGGDVRVQPSQLLVVEWTAGVVGSRATAYLDGTMTMR